MGFKWQKLSPDPDSLDFMQVLCYIYKILLMKLVKFALLSFSTDQSVSHFSTIPKSQGAWNQHTVRMTDQLS